MNVPVKYSNLVNEGCKPQELLIQLKKDGFGKLRSIATLRVLFNFSLIEANHILDIFENDLLGTDTNMSTK